VWVRGRAWAGGVGVLGGPWRGWTGVGRGGPVWGGGGGGGGGAGGRLPRRAGGAAGDGAITWISGSVEVSWASRLPGTGSTARLADPPIRAPRTSERPSPRAPRIPGTSHPHGEPRRRFVPMRLLDDAILVDDL